MSYENVFLWCGLSWVVVVILKTIMVREPKPEKPEKVSCVHCDHAAPARAEFCPRCGGLVRHKTPETHPEYAPAKHGGGVVKGRWYVPPSYENFGALWMSARERQAANPLTSQVWTWSSATEITDVKWQKS